MTNVKILMNVLLQFVPKMLFVSTPLEAMIVVANLDMLVTPSNFVQLKMEDKSMTCVSTKSVDPMLYVI